MLLAVLIFNASSQSQIAAPNIVGVDKIGHFVVFGWLGVLLARWSAVARIRPLGMGTAIVIVSLYGALDEFHQSLTPGRGVEVADWIADTLGAIVAVTIYARWSTLRGWLERAPFAPSRT